MVSHVTHDNSAVRANVRARARDVTKSAFPPKKKHQSTPGDVGYVVKLRSGEVERARSSEILDGLGSSL